MTARQSHLLLLIALFAAVAFVGCAESEDPTEIPIRAHPESWVEPTSEDFHGEYIRNLAEGSRAEDAVVDGPLTGTEGCASCHGDFGRSDGEQCFACHATGNPESGGHPAVNVWLAPQADGFHGQALAQAMGSEDCAICHGLEFQGGWSGVDCQTCHPYSDLNSNGLWNPHPGPDDWYDSSSDDFHGRAVQLRGPQDCKSCHNEFPGEDKWAGVVCSQCHAGGASGHPSEEVWLTNALHGQQDPDDCRSCHGQDLTTGGTAGVACNDCHTWPYGN